MVKLPVGLSVNPDAADGQTACTDDEADFDSEASAECPDTAKIGTFSIETPALDKPLRGALYIGEPKPGQPVQAGHGRVRLRDQRQGRRRDPHRSPQRPGDVPVSDLPQVPFEDVQGASLRVGPGPAWRPRRNALSTRSTRCSRPGTIGSRRSIPNPLRLSRARRQARARSGSHVQSAPRRRDVEPDRRRLLELPPEARSRRWRPVPRRSRLQDAAGLHRLSAWDQLLPRGVDRGRDQNLGRVEQTNPSCPASSEVGTSNVAAGPGNTPLPRRRQDVPGRAAQRAPLSLAAITPALAGPYDYGTVVVRVALRVDPLTAQVTRDSDTVPQIIGGIPIRMRRSRSTSTSRTSQSIRRTARIHVDSQGIGDQGTSPTSPRSSRWSTAQDWPSGRR